MNNWRLQNSTAEVQFKAFLTGTDTPATGKTIAIQLRKVGGSFANPNAGASNATEIANGWYRFTPAAQDRDTLGPLIWRGTEGTIDPAETEELIVDPVRLGITALPNAAAEAAGGLFTRGTGAGQVNQDANGRLDINQVARAGVALTASGDVADHFADVCEYATLQVTGTTAIKLPIKTLAGAVAGSGDWTPATGDVQVSLDGGAYANVTNLPTFNNGWEIVMTAAQTTGADIKLRIVDQGTKVIRDCLGLIKTFGNASAYFADNFRVSSGVAQTGDSFARLGAPAGASVSADIALLRTLFRGMVLANGTIGATGNDTTHLHLAGLAYADDTINNHFLVVLDVSTGLYYTTSITDFVNSTDLATVATLPFTPEASVDQYWLLSMKTSAAGGDATAANQTTIMNMISALNNLSQAQAADAAAAALLAYDPPTHTELATALTAQIAALLATTIHGQTVANLLSAGGSFNVQGSADGLLLTVRGHDGTTITTRPIVRADFQAIRSAG